jgi:hypothetical protein
MPNDSWHYRYVDIISVGRRHRRRYIPSQTNSNASKKTSKSAFITNYGNKITIWIRNFMRKVFIKWQSKARRFRSGGIMALLTPIRIRKGREKNI